MADQEQKAIQFMDEAEKKLKSSKSFFGSMFGYVFSSFLSTDFVLYSETQLFDLFCAYRHAMQNNVRLEQCSKHKDLKAMSWQRPLTNLSLIWFVLKW